MIRVSTIMRICVLYLIAWLIAPPLAYGTIFRLLAVAAAGVWFLSHLFQNKTKKSVSSQLLMHYLLAVVLYVLFTVLIETICAGKAVSAIVSEKISSYILLFVGYVAGYYVINREQADFQIFFKWIVLLLVVFSITSLLRSEKFQYITRASGSYEDDPVLMRQAAARGIGGFGFFCVSAVLSPVLLYLAIIKKNRQRIWLVISFILVELGVISAGFTLALTISMIGILICVLSTVKNPILKLLFVLVFLILLLFSQELLTMLYKFLRRISQETMYENKVRDIFAFLLDGESDGSFEGRAVRYRTSLNALWKYPILGSYVWEGRNRTGTHSSLIDNFGAYGWLAGALWLYIIVLYPNRLGKVISSKPWPRIMVIISIILTATFNQYAMQMGVFYFILPAASYYALEDQSVGSGG